MRTPRNVHDGSNPAHWTALDCSCSRRPSTPLCDGKWVRGRQAGIQVLRHPYITVRHNIFTSPTLCTAMISRSYALMSILVAARAAMPLYAVKLPLIQGIPFRYGNRVPRYTLIPVSTAGSLCSGSLYYTHLDHDNGWAWIGEFTASRYMSIAAKFLRHGPTPSQRHIHACLLGLSSELSLPSARLKAPRSPSPGPRKPTPIAPHCC
jgi:hypothetical protein